MEKQERSDPTFTIFVVLAAIFIVALAYVMFPRHASSPATTNIPDAPTKK